MSLPQYQNQIDSGVAWLGSVPTHWEVRRFKWLIERSDGGVWGEDPDGLDDTIVLRSTEQTVDGNWRIDEPAKRKISGKDRSTALLGIGDLLLTKSSGSALHIGKTTLVDAAIANLNACYSNFMQRLRITDRLLPKIAWYILNNGISRVQMDVLSNSTTGLANLNGTIIGELVLALPPLSEQTAIAAFLDHETAKIDALIAEQEKLLTLLAEKRQATISHAVTRGLNPNAPMRDSGVAWLGEVPAHWDIGVLKRHWTVTDCKHITAEFVEDGIPLASIREVQSQYISLDNSKKTTQHFYEQLIEGGRKPRAGDLIFSRNATVGEVSQVAECHPDFAMGQDVCLLRKINENDSSDYMQAVIRSGVVVEQLKNLMVGSTFKRVNVEEIRSIIIPMPPEAEQASIYRFIGDEIHKLDILKSEAEAAVSLLRERRIAMITSAVTGKIDVRNAVAKELAA